MQDFRKIARVTVFNFGSALVICPGMPHTEAYLGGGGTLGHVLHLGRRRCTYELMAPPCAGIEIMAKISKNRQNDKNNRQKIQAKISKEGKNPGKNKEMSLLLKKSFTLAPSSHGKWRP